MNPDQKMEYKTKRFNRDTLLYAVMAILCVVLLIQLVAFVINVWDYQDNQQGYTADEAELISMVTTQEYSTLAESVHRNEAAGVSVKGDMAELYAVAYYYEAAMLYQAHESAGNAEQAKRQYAKMQEYEKKMGGYSFVKEEIWDFLGSDQEILK